MSETNKATVYLDGTAWTAVRPDFIDLQSSPAGFGDNPTAAVLALIDKEVEELQAHKARVTSALAV